jgi:hypothetical protein
MVIQMLLEAIKGIVREQIGLAMVGVLDSSSNTIMLEVIFFNIYGFEQR